MDLPTPPPEWTPPQVPPPPGQPPPPPLGGSLHPAAIGVWSTAQAGVLVFLVVINPVSLVVAVPLVMLSVVANVVRWVRFRWRLEAGALIIEQGLIQRRRRVIPLERVQGVDVVRRITHRLFGVVGVHVEAIGGSSTEGVLDALSHDVADRLRTQLLAGRGAQAGASPAPITAEPERGTVLATASGRTLVVAGLTQANAGVLAAVVGAGWQLFGDRLESIAQLLPRILPRLQETAAIVLVLVALVIAVVAMFVLAQVLAFWGFRLVREQDELRIRRGLLEQRLDTIPLRRLQALRIEENLLRRALGRAALKCDIAGRPGGGGETGTLLPLGSRREAITLAGTVLGLEALPTVDLAPMPGRARTRRLVRAGAAVAVITAASAATWGPSGLAAAALIAPALGAAEASYRALGWAEIDGHVIARAGLWTRRTAIVPTANLQSLALHATLPQRWRRLVTLDLQIARSPGIWAGPQLIDLDAGAGAGLLERLRARAASPTPRPGGGRRIRTSEG